MGLVMLLTHMQINSAKDMVLKVYLQNEIANVEVAGNTQWGTRILQEMLTLKELRPEGGEWDQVKVTGANPGDDMNQMVFG